MLFTTNRNAGWIRLIPLVLIILLASCNDTAGPTADASLVDTPVLATGTPHHLKWNTAAGPARFSAVLRSQEGEIPLAPNSDLEPLAAESGQLGTYKVAFWAVRGQTRSIHINYVADKPTNGVVEFLELEVTEPVRRPDGSEIAVGDSVMIGVYVDPMDLAVHLMPSGLQFGSSVPTELDISYAQANPDFNGDGVVDQRDQYIEQELLGTWYQHDFGIKWEGIEAQHDMEDKEFEIILEHFSGYAVAW